MRLSDVSAGMVIVAKCGRCNRRRALVHHRLTKRYGKDARLLSLELALKCTGCSSRAACRIELQAVRRD